MIEFSMLYVRNLTRREFTSLRQANYSDMLSVWRSGRELCSSQPRLVGSSNCDCAGLPSSQRPQVDTCFFEGGFRWALGCSAKPLVVQLSK